MNRFVNFYQRLTQRLRSNGGERGFTLIELLASLTLLSVIMGVIYSSITFGLNTYHKVRIQNELRDEGDVIMSTIISELYQVGPTRISQTDPYHQSMVLTLPEIQSEDGSDSSSVLEPIQIRAVKQADGTDKNTLVIGSGVNERIIEAQSDIVVDRTDPSASSITVSCMNNDAANGCGSGLIEIKLKLRQEFGNKNYDLDLESRFGF
ncbi:prepilin-type N-terminal cleavage/methylation domain-containing protein [Paenibacillus taihuensis]|uniref:Prepilin-type N-terminal cleavage/methylation domain-containing protein n=1 Tax=Paenibacillus taihuensis TaxID=1156355 RepID=A0A3D9QTI5_9BACL|nr:prepilin-type N-terminal cleavage/methylation domain-containing protein [Paenibacillus taihuensis]REE66679.1 prepilin-type N-terminal cleavage/methylation domain-containing protein [Paenibacillus taihuensis]